MKFKFILTIPIIVSFILSCSTTKQLISEEELEELQSELTSANENITSKQNTIESLKEENEALALSVTENEATIAELEAEIEVLKGKILQLVENTENFDDKYAVLENEKRELEKTVRDIQFAQSMLMLESKNVYESQKYSGIEETTRTTTEDRRPSSDNTDSALYNDIQARRGATNGGQEFLDSRTNVSSPQALFLQINQETPGIPEMVLIIRHSFAPVADETAIQKIFFRDNRQEVELDVSEAEIEVSESDIYLGITVKLQFSDTVFDFLKASLTSKDPKIVFRTEKRERSRAISQEQVEALGNVLYLYQELGGELP